jgi:hypothetical protein
MTTFLVEIQIKGVWHDPGLQLLTPPKHHLDFVPGIGVRQAFLPKLGNSPAGGLMGIACLGCPTAGTWRSQPVLLVINRNTRIGQLC